MDFAPNWISIWDCRPLSGIETPASSDILIWTLFWTALYGCLSLSLPKESPEWISRVQACFHGFVALVLAARCMFADDDRHPLDAGRLHQPNTPIQNLTLVISASYFLYDLIWCLIYMGNDVTMLLHHVSSAGALVVSLILGESGYEAVITLAGAEITQPFLQTRWYLRELGMYNNNTFAWINDTIFLLTFTFMRLGWGSGLAYLYFIKGVEGHPVIKAGGAFLYALSVVWCFMIWKVYIGRYVLPQSRNKNKSKEESKLR